MYQKMNTENVPCRKKMSPNIEGFICQLEKTKHTVFGRAAWVAIPWNDSILMENLKRNKYLFENHIYLSS